MQTSLESFAGIRMTKAAIDRFGLSSSASRTSTGTSELHLELETALSEFAGTTGAVVLSSGYLAMHSLLEGICKDGDLILVQDTAHSSIRQAVEMTGLSFREFRLDDLASFENALNHSAPNFARVVVAAEGVRENLRVLLVSGEPHAGERTWRNLLKSDAAVDLVHFTILRPPEKQDGTPINQLSLIAFPTRELFSEKIKDFDLIIFDRYQHRGILQMIYYDNIARYVEEDGGAVLVAAADISSKNPAIPHDFFCCLGIFIISHHHTWTFNNEFPFLIMGQFLAVLIQ